MSEFAEYVKECFSELGDIHYRKMFGGYGIYLDGVMFALIADEQLYLKADEQGSNLFKEQNLPPFQYSRAEKIVRLSYFLAPDAVFEDRETAALWGRRAHQTAVRGKHREKPSSLKP